MSFKEIEKIIKKDGWVEIRVAGSHHQYKKIGCAYLAVIPHHGSRDISIGVIKNLEKMTGLSLR